MDVTGVKQNIAGIFERRKAAVYALSLKWAAIALNYFRSVQPSAPNSSGQFWHNRTAQAANRMFSDAFMEEEGDEIIIGWFMAHGVSYGPYLELANNRAHESIKPIIERYAGRFIREVQELYVD